MEGHGRGVIVAVLAVGFVVTSGVLGAGAWWEPRLAHLQQRFAAGSGAAIAQSGRATELQGVRVEPRNGGLLVLLAGNGRLEPSTVGRAAELPHRVYLDFTNVRSSVPLTTPVNSGSLRRIRTAQNSDTPLVTRVVLDLTEAADYSIVPSKGDGEPLGVFIRSSAATAAPAAPAAPAPPAATAEPRTTPAAPSVVPAPIQANVQPPTPAPGPTRLVSQPRPGASSAPTAAAAPAQNSVAAPASPAGTFAPSETVILPPRRTATPTPTTRTTPPTPAATTALVSAPRPSPAPPTVAPVERATEVPTAPAPLSAGQWMVVGDLGIERDTGYWRIAIDNALLAGNREEIVTRTGIPYAARPAVAGGSTALLIRLGLTALTSDPEVIYDPKKGPLERTDLILIDRATGQRIDPAFFEGADLADRSTTAWATFVVPQAARELTLRIHRRGVGQTVDYNLRVAGR